MYFTVYSTASKATVAAATRAGGWRGAGMGAGVSWRGTLDTHTDYRTVQYERHTDLHNYQLYRTVKRISRRTPTPQRSPEAG